MKTEKKGIIKPAIALPVTIWPGGLFDADRRYIGNGATFQLTHAIAAALNGQDKLVEAAETAIEFMDLNGNPDSERGDAVKAQLRSAIAAARGKG